MMTNECTAPNDEALLEGPTNQKVMSIFFLFSFLFFNVFFIFFLLYLFHDVGCLDKMKSHEIQGLFTWSDVRVEGL